MTSLMRFMVVPDGMIEGVGAIDRQHARMVEIINDLCAVTLNHLPITQLDRVLDDIQTYVLHHFDYENALFEITSYPAAEEHRRSHEAIKQQIANYRAAINRDNRTIMAAELLHFVRSELIKHTLTDDREACHHFRRHGIK